MSLVFVLSAPVDDVIQLLSESYFNSEVPPPFGRPGAASRIIRTVIKWIYIRLPPELLRLPPKLLHLPPVY